MERRLAAAVMETFREDTAQGHGARLSAFPLRAWTANFYWLDASGMALYFLDRVKNLDIEDALPELVLQRLDRNLTDNRLRMQEIFAEFVKINTAFQDAGLPFVNLKGFSLVPEYCADPALRFQSDLDFLVAHRDAQRCREVLGRLGYVLTGVSNRQWEFKAGAGELPGIQDLYKAKPQRCVEVRFAPSTKNAEEGCAAQARTMTWNGFSFPALATIDAFYAQALHLQKHLRSEWTRAAWLLEYKNFVIARKQDAGFWRDVKEKESTVPEGKAALGVATLLATTVFGKFAPPALSDWAVNELAHPVRMWVERYGHEVLLSDFPGTKLYLLFPDGPAQRKGSVQKNRRERLFPLHRAPSIVHGPAKKGFPARARRGWMQAGFVLFRLRFHLRQGLRYMLEAPRWKKIVAASQQ